LIHEPVSILKESKSNDLYRPGTSQNEILKRAATLRAIREFFHEKKVIEVQTPSLCQYPTVDTHLESFEVPISREHSLYLITSPEYHMKRLIAEGSGSIYQIAQAFRSGEKGAKHNIEFTILEWYRTGWNQSQLITEVDQLIQLLLNTPPADQSNYTDIFLELTGLNPFTFSHSQFLQFCKNRNHQLPDYLLNRDINKDECLNYLMGCFIEPELGLNKPIFITEYPLSQSPLARKIQKHGDSSSRFELFYKGFELANGFYELKDAKEQIKRFEAVNLQREEMGKKPLPIDQRFIQSLESGFPDCSGVAMGVDRILMLACNKRHIDQVMSFSYDRC